MVPILHNIEQKSLEQLQAEWSDLMPRARARKLSPNEYANPTFTISNMGMFGVTHFTAIPTPGIAAIMAIAATGRGRHAGEHHRRSSCGERRARRRLPGRFEERSSKIRKAG